MQSFLKDPLLHCLAAGVLMFLLYGLVSEKPSPESTKRIVITQDDIQRLGHNWVNENKRPPSDVELHNLIDAFIREEIYYREALAIGLDRNDPVIRKHLMQKMEFLTQDLADLSNPDESTLLAYMQANRSRYTPDARISFQHIFFSPRRSGTPAEVAARHTRAKLAENSKLTGANAGDRFVLSDQFTRQPRADVARLFGDGFVEELSALPMGSWQGPIRSEHGIHLVRVNEILIPGMPDLGAVYDQVKADWSYERRQKTNASFYLHLKAQYDVRVAPYTGMPAKTPITLPGQEAL